MVVITDKCDFKISDSMIFMSNLKQICSHFLRKSHIEISHDYVTLRLRFFEHVTCNLHVCW